MLPLIPPLPREPAAVPPTAADVEIPRGDPNLRSAVEVEGYHVAASDGEIGHIDDFLVDDTDWSLRFLVIDTRNWLPGRKEIGRASCRGRVCRDVVISVVAGSLKKKNTEIEIKRKSNKKNT